MRKIDEAVRIGAFITALTLMALPGISRRRSTAGRAGCSMAITQA